MLGYLNVVIMALVAFIYPMEFYAHTGGLNKEGCHSGSKPYHCHKQDGSHENKTSESEQSLTGIVTHVRDGDTLEVNGIAIRLAALNCPENRTKEGRRATKIAEKFKGMTITCELTGAKTYDRLVGYCSIGGEDVGRFMMQKSSCKVWKKYDVWKRY